MDEEVEEEGGVRTPGRAWIWGHSEGWSGRGEGLMRNGVRCSETGHRTSPTAGHLGLTGGWELLPRSDPP